MSTPADALPPGPDGAPDARPGLAALWMIGAILSFSSMAVAGRAASLSLDTFEIMTYRSAIGLVIMGAVAGLGLGGPVRFRRLPLHFLRNVSHFAGQNLWFYAITVAPLAQVFALEFTSPLWVIALAALFLGERITPLKLAAGAVGFIGVLIVLRPWAEAISPGALTAALAAIAFAGSAITTKLLTRTETVVSILLILTAMQLVLGLICAGLDADIAWPDAAAWPWIGVIAVAGLTAHFCLTTALTLAPASVVMPLDFVRLPAIAVIGVALYGEPLLLSVFLGAALIFGANYVNILSASRRR